MPEGPPLPAVSLDLFHVAAGHASWPGSQPPVFRVAATSAPPPAGHSVQCAGHPTGHHAGPGCPLEPPYPKSQGNILTTK